MGHAMGDTIEPTPVREVADRDISLGQGPQMTV